MRIAVEQQKQVFNVGSSLFTLQFGDKMKFLLQKEICLNKRVYLVAKYVLISAQC